MTKEELRSWAKNKRKNISKKINEILVYKLTQTKEYKFAKNIMIFYPLEYEVNLLSLLDDEEKNFYLPKIENDNLLCCPYKKGDKTCLSAFKTCEPLTEACEKNSIDLAIIPALACDKDNYRLGYGGGFYDRFLKNFCGYKITCLPSELVIDTVYPENYDIKLDKIITETDD